MDNHYICFIVGGKGGVGKSMASMGTVDFFVKHLGRKIILIECDTSNPDVGKTLLDNEYVEVISLSLDTIDGWIELVNCCESSDRDIIINSAARLEASIAKFINILVGSLEELRRILISLWVINRQRDSIELLKKYMEIVPGELHVVRNTFYGEPEQFQLFNESKTRTEAEKRGATINLPDLADRVADDLYSKRLSIDKAAEIMPLGNRSEIKRWRTSVWKMFDEIGLGKIQSEEKTS